MNETTALAPVALVPQSRPSGENDAVFIELWLSLKVSSHTRRAYAADVERLLAFIRKPLGWITLAMSRRTRRRWSREASNRPARTGRSPQSNRCSPSARRPAIFPFNVGAAVKLRPNRDSLAQRILEESEVAKLIEAAPEGRNRVLLKLLYVSGIRVSELCGLKWCDAVPRAEGGQITVFGKRGKTRTILLKPKPWTQLLSIRGDAGPVDPIFRSRKGGHLGCVSGPPHRLRRRKKGRPRTEGLPALDAPRPRQPRARPQRSDSPGSGDPRARLGFDHRPLPARPPDRKLQSSIYLISLFTFPQ